MENVSMKQNLMSQAAGVFTPRNPPVSPSFLDLIVVYIQLLKWIQCYLVFNKGKSDLGACFVWIFLFVLQLHKNNICTFLIKRCIKNTFSVRAVDCRRCRVQTGGMCYVIRARYSHVAVLRSWSAAAGLPCMLKNGAEGVMWCSNEKPVAPDDLWRTIWKQVTHSRTFTLPMLWFKVR